MIKSEFITNIVASSAIWLDENVLVISTFVQLTISFLAYILATFLAKKPREHLKKFINVRFETKLNRFSESAILDIVAPVLWLFLQWIVIIILTAVGMENNVLKIISKLLTAWVIIRLTSSIVKYSVWSKYIAVIAWSIAALSIVDLLEPTTKLLDSFAIQMGGLRISVLSVISGIFTLVILLWLSGALSKTIERKIHELPNLTPSLQVLLSKSAKIILITIAIFVGLNSIGIDLTAITVLGGAIGLGLGFGLQKVVSNLVSGIILLIDRSVKPGDVIEVDGTYGWVNSLSARYVSVLTRDGVEHLIPNEYLITEKVTNWSYSNKNVRIKIPVGISYDADVVKALDIILEVAKENRRVLKSPPPVSRLIEFADSSINLELRVWINDPVEGVVNVKSDVLIEIWKKFKENNIQIPFPQREVSLKISKDLEALLKNK